MAFHAYVISNTDPKLEPVGNRRVLLISDEFMNTEVRHAYMEGYCKASGEFFETTLSFEPSEIIAVKR